MAESVGVKTPQKPAAKPVAVKAAPAPTASTAPKAVESKPAAAPVAAKPAPAPKAAPAPTAVAAAAPAPAAKPAPAKTPTPEAALAAAREPEGMAQFTSLQAAIVDAVQANTNAVIAHAQALAAAGSFSEAVRLQSSFARETIETWTSQAREIGAIGMKLAAGGAVPTATVWSFQGFGRA